MKAGSSVASPGCRRFHSRNDTTATVTPRVALKVPLRDEEWVLKGLAQYNLDRDLAALGGITMQAPRLRTSLAGGVGNLLEWYDFAVFGYFAPFISTQFFPADDPVAALINTFGVFAAGYLVRPIGGVLFGPIGDRLGRARALQLSIFVMAVPTTLMASLPTHAQVGFLAPALLVVLRLAQGLSVGGEYIGSCCYLVEAAPAERRGLFGSWVPFGTVAGMLLGSAVATLMHNLLSRSRSRRGVGDYRFSVAC